MTAAEYIVPEPQPRETYLNVSYGVKSWLLTKDHKRIALLYLASITFFFFLGGLFALLIRLELLTPAGDLVQSETYNKLFTMHGIVMIFFFLIPSIPAVLGNFLIPMMIGAKDLAFPRLNLLSWYIYIVGALFTLWAVVHGGVDTGWTFYTPYSTTSSNGHVVATAVGVFITGFSSILTGLNFIVTIHTMRAPGLTWFRLPSSSGRTTRPASSWCWARRSSPSRSCWSPSSGSSTSGSSTRRSAATRCSSSTCSGSTRTRPSTS